MKTIRNISLTAAVLVGLTSSFAMAQDAPLPDPADMSSERPMRMRGPDHRIDFEAIDLDKNGTVTKAELLTRATERMTLADTNGDGSLDRAELIAAMPGSRGHVTMIFAPDPAARRADRMLAKMGATESGRVEIAALSERNVNDMIARLDDDRDGAISAAEARPAHWGHGEGGRGKPHG